MIGAGMAGRDAAEIGAVALRRAVPELRAGERPAASSVGDGRGPLVRLGVDEEAGVRVTRVPLEDYVAGVVAAEASPGAPAALREALAIAARSYAMANLGRHERDGFDLCDLTHCQVCRRPDDASVLAARKTAGLGVRVSGRVVSAFHSASCGGALEAPGALWPATESPDRVMPARPDPVVHDTDSWQSEVAAPDLQRALRVAGVRGDTLRGLSVTARTASGRVREVHLAGLTPGVMSGEAFRLAVGRTLGWHLLKSSLFTATRTARGYRFDGRGRGHGVGLCVLGATRLAEQGHSAREIPHDVLPRRRCRRVARGRDAGHRCASRVAGTRRGGTGQRRRAD